MPLLVRLLTWVVRGVVFLFLLLFAMKNTDPVTLRFYFDQAWSAPLALVLFLTLVFGAVLGLVAGLERVMAQRREILALKRELRVRHAEAARRPESAVTEEEEIVRRLAEGHASHP